MIETSNKEENKNKNQSNNNNNKKMNEKLELALNKMKSMQKYCENIKCRREMLLNYFGETCTNITENQRKQMKCCDVCIDCNKVKQQHTLQRQNYESNKEAKFMGTHQNDTDFVKLKDQNNGRGKKCQVLLHITYIKYKHKPLIVVIIIFIVFIGF